MEAYFFCSGPGQINAMAAPKRPPVIDTNNNGIIVVEINNPHHCIKRKFKMGCSIAYGIKPFAAGSFFMIKTGGIPYSGSTAFDNNTGVDST
jgi:hypothetical protein